MLPTSIKRIGSKTNEKRWRHHFPHYKSMRTFCCHGNQFWCNLLKNLMQPFPHPNDATYKIWSRLANWLHRYSSSKVWNFRHSRASNSKMWGLIQPKIELDQAFMPVLITSNFDDDSIKKERARMETPFSHYKSMGNILDAQGQLTPKSVVRSGRNSNSSKFLCMSSLQGWVANSTPGIFQWNLQEYSGLENMPKVANMANMEKMILVL